MITPEYILGSIGRPYGVGAPPEPWPAHDGCLAYWRRDEGPGYGVLYTRYRVNAGRVGQPSREGIPAWLDIWEEGVFRAAQEGPRAIVGYGLMPRGQRPVESLRLDIRLLGPNVSAVRFDGRAWDGRPLDLAPGVPVVVADGSTLIGIVPVDPTMLGQASPIVLWKDGMETVLSIVNYEGAAKVFWEYRSLSGSFWKGNVRNGFCLWMAPVDEWADAAAFERALRDTAIRDEIEDSVRRIDFGDVKLEYDLRAMWP